MLLGVEMLNLKSAKNVKRMNEVEYYALLVNLSKLYDDMNFADYEMALMAHTSNEKEYDDLEDAVYNHRLMVKYLNSIQV